MSRHEHVLRRPRRQRRHKHAFLDGLQAVKPLGDHQVARALGLRVHERCETPERGSKHASAAARVPAHVISPALLTKERRCAAKEWGLGFRHLPSPFYGWSARFRVHAHLEGVIVLVLISAQLRC